MTGILAALIGSVKKAFGWTTATVTSQVYRDAVYADLTNGKYFAFGTNSTGGSTTAYSYSTDGTNWSTGTLPALSSWTGAATNGTRIVVIRSSATSGYYTDNGTTWTATGSLSGTAVNPKQALWDGSRFIAGFASGTVLYYSTNGTGAWSTTLVGDQLAGVGPVGFDGSSRYIVFDADINAQTTARTTTTFPSTWSTITVPSGKYRGVAYGAGIWVIMRPGSTGYATSTNGTTWTSRTLPATFAEATGDDYAKLLFTNSKFYYYSPDNVYSSTDGINWTNEATITGGNLDAVNGWAVGGNLILGFGANSNTAGSDIYLKGQ